MTQAVTSIEGIRMLANVYLKGGDEELLEKVKKAGILPKPRQEDTAEAEIGNNKSAGVVA